MYILCGIGSKCAVWTPHGDQNRQWTSGTCFKCVTALQEFSLLELVVQRYICWNTDTDSSSSSSSTVHCSTKASRYAGQTSRYKLYFSSFPFSSQCSCRTIIYSCNIHGDTIICSLWQSTFKLLLARTQILFSLSQTRQFKKGTDVKVSLCIPI